MQHSYLPAVCGAKIGAKSVETFEVAIPLLHNMVHLKDHIVLATRRLDFVG